MAIKAPFTPEECRKNARDCRELQKRAPNHLAGETLLKIADAWDRLADQLGRQKNGGTNPPAT